MTHITICTDCGCCYEESSEEAANAPDRLCSRCWQKAARKRLAENPAPAHVSHFSTCPQAGQHRRRT